MFEKRNPFSQNHVFPERRESLWGHLEGSASMLAPARPSPLLFHAENPQWLQINQEMQMRPRRRYVRFILKRSCHAEKWLV